MLSIGMKLVLYEVLLFTILNTERPKKENSK